MCLFTSTVSIHEREGHSICHALSTDKFPLVVMVSLWLPAIALANKIGACSFNASLPVACCPSSGRVDSSGQKISALHGKCKLGYQLAIRTAKGESNARQGRNSSFVKGLASTLSKYKQM